MKKESIKAKEVLSANKETFIKVSELVDYDTLSTKMDRTQLEALLDEDFKKVSEPALKALELAGLAVEDLDTIELIGGGVRVPKVQDILKEVFPGKELGAHLNGDEAMCFGSAFIASNSSTSFKVKKIFLTQSVPETYSIRIQKLEPEAEEFEEIQYTKTAKLFKKGDVMGLKKSLSIAYDQDMYIQLFQGELQDEESAFDESQMLSEFKIKGIADLKNNHIGKKEGSSKPKIKLEFEMSRSGYVTLNKVEAKMEELVFQNETIKKPVIETTPNAEQESAEANAEGQEAD